MDYMKNIAVLVGFFIATPITLIIAASFLIYLTYNPSDNVLGVSTKGVAYAALPPSDSSIQNTIIQKGSKEEIVRQFLAKYNSPLEPYASDVVNSANRHNLDFRILPAIAMQESTVCKKIIKDSHNCWGWGIYGGKVTKFDNYPHAIETITIGLSTKYRAQGLVSIEEIGKLYNPSNTNNWVENVTFIMDQLQ